jgi:hypothetical protein
MKNKGSPATLSRVNPRLLSKTEDDEATGAGQGKKNA